MKARTVVGAGAVVLSAWLAPDSLARADEPEPSAPPSPPAPAAAPAPVEPPVVPAAPVPPAHSGPLRWDPAWSHANAWDYTLTGVGLTWLVTETILSQPNQPPLHWSGAILFDEDVREIFRGSTQKIRDDAATASWVAWTIEMAYPFAVDIPYAWVRYGKQVAWDMFWQSSTAISLSAAFDLALRDSVGRARPNNADCLARGGTNCLDSSEATRSFPSGHVTETTTATALICTQHLMLHLYGSPGDAITCGAAVATDATVMSLRLVTDNHYASDMMGSIAIGIAFGAGIPIAMHLHGSTTPDARPPSVMVVPTPVVLKDGGGLGVTGIF